MASSVERNEQVAEAAQPPNSPFKLSSDYLKRPDHSQIDVDFECIVCLQPLDIDTAGECLTCEVAICRHDIDQLDGGKCPQCRQQDKGFRDSLGRHHRQLISMLEFQCPQPDCRITLRYEDAKRHIPRCMKHEQELASKLAEVEERTAE